MTRRHPSMSRDGHLRADLRIPVRATLGELTAAATLIATWWPHRYSDERGLRAMCAAGILEAGGPGVAQVRLDDQLSDAADPEVMAGTYNTLLHRIAAAYGFPPPGPGDELAVPDEPDDEG